MSVLFIVTKSFLFLLSKNEGYVSKYIYPHVTDEVVEVRIGGRYAYCHRAIKLSSSHASVAFSSIISNVKN
jgi:hypothetical protein